MLNGEPSLVQADSNDFLETIPSIEFVFYEPFYHVKAGSWHRTVVMLI